MYVSMHAYIYNGCVCLLDICLYMYTEICRMMSAGTVAAAMHLSPGEALSDPNILVELGLWSSAPEGMVAFRCI